MINRAVNRDRGRSSRLEKSANGLLAKCFSIRRFCSLAVPSRVFFVDVELGIFVVSSRSEFSLEFERVFVASCGDVTLSVPILK